MKIKYNCEKHGATESTIRAKNICKDFFLPCKNCQSFNKSVAAPSQKKDKEFYYKRLAKYCSERNGKLLSPEWVTAKSTYRFRCSNPNHPIFESTADAIYSGGHWCPYCCGRKGDFEEEIKNIIQSKNGELLSSYEKANVPLTVKCKTHDFTWKILSGNIKKGRWCPVCNLPYSEKVVWDYFKNHICNIAPQYKFEDLKTNGERLKFDFAVLDSNSEIIYLIEIDDVTHKYNHPKSERHQLKRKRDQLKNKYCENNNIPLYRMDVPFSNVKWSYDDYYRYINTELKFIVNLCYSATGGI